MNLYTLLPSEIVEKIWNFLPLESKVLVLKKYYEKYHSKVILPKITNYDGYMRFVIRNNYSYLFKMNLNYYDSWVSKRNWKYKKQIFCNFADYIYFLTSNQPKIYYILKEFEKIHQKNKHKNIKHKYIKWSN
jgi:hypothetical protein